jgi:lipopolysaccharide biosynthesis regulator YciM
MFLLRVATSNLGMFDDAALILEEMAPENKTRNEVLGARVDLYMAARKWDMAAAVASHLVKVDPETAGWWSSLEVILAQPRPAPIVQPYTGW